MKKKRLKQKDENPKQMLIYNRMKQLNQTDVHLPERTTLKDFLLFQLLDPAYGMTKEPDLCCLAFSSETYPNPFLFSFILGQDV